MEEEVISQINMEVEAMSFNELTELGNKAVACGLIIGHGYHKSQYEILRRDEELLLSPQEARAYLKNLLEQVGL